MTYQVLVHRKAQEYYKSLPAEMQKRIKNGLQELAKNPLNPRPKADIKKLAGTKGRKPAYRLRVGDYRVIYDIDKKEVYVTLIFHRGKGYSEI